MAASDEGQRIFVCAGRSDRPIVEYDCYRGLGRSKTSRGAVPADRQLQRSSAARIARVNFVGESDWDGANRTPAPADGGLYFEADDGSRSAVVDFAGCGAALRYCDGQRAADRANAAGKVDVERQEDSYSRRRAFEVAALDAVLFGAQGYRPVLCCV